MKDDDACEEVREIKMMKDDVIKEMFENMKHSAPQAIPWKTYCKTVRIISSQNNVLGTSLSLEVCSSSVSSHSSICFISMK